MSGGISRVHSGVKPGNLAGVALSDFYLGFHAADATAVTADWNGGTGTVAGGALDQIFRTAVETVGTVSRVGTLGGVEGAGTLAFTVEVLGSDANSPGALGQSNTSTTAFALTNAVQALGTVTFTDPAGVSRTVHCSSASVTAFTF